MKRAVLLWPPVFLTAFWPHLVQPTTGRVGKPLFLKRKKKKGCLFWSFNFVSHQWAGPTHCAAACLLGPTGMAVGKAEPNCPSSSSQPFKQVWDRQMQPPCVVGRARGPALPGQPQLGSQALASLGLLNSCLSYLLWLIPEVHFDFGETFIEPFCLIKMVFTSFSEFHVMHILTYCSPLWTLVQFYKRMALFTLNCCLPRYLKSGKYSL